MIVGLKMTTTNIVYSFNINIINIDFLTRLPTHD